MLQTQRPRIRTKEQDNKTVQKPDHGRKNLKFVLTISRFNIMPEASVAYPDEFFFTYVILGKSSHEGKNDFNRLTWELKPASGTMSKLPADPSPW